jgi:hypothetical protein
MPRGSLTDVTTLMTIADQLSFRAAASRLGDSLGPQPLEAGSTPRNRVGGSDCTSVAALLSAYQGVHPELQVSEENVDMVAKSFDAGIGPNGGGGHD